MKYQLSIDVGYNHLVLTYDNYQAMITAIENILAGAADPVSFTAQIVPEKDEETEEDGEGNE